MDTKWFYVLSAVAGGLIPVAYVYVRLSGDPNLTGNTVDPILAFRGIALGLMVTPIGLGLTAAAVGHVVFSKFVRSSSFFRSGSSRVDHQSGAGGSWVSQRRRTPASIPTEEPQKNRA